jgi:hypothetical protein
MDAFHNSQEFLKAAKGAAKRTGYDPAKLDLARDSTHKLVYESPEGVRRFGARGYGDFIYFSKFEPQIADQKRQSYRKRADGITRKYGYNKYSPNELAKAILW